MMTSTTTMGFTGHTDTELSARLALADADWELLSVWKFTDLRPEAHIDALASEILRIVLNERCLPEKAAWAAEVIERCRGPK